MAYQSEIEKLEQRFHEKPEQWFAALADAYRKAGELDMALDILNTWIEQRPNYTSGHIVHGRCLLDKEQTAEAARVFEGVLQLDPENIIAIKTLSEIAEQGGDVGGARHWLERLLEVDPMNDEAREALERLGAAAEAAAPVSEEVEGAERAVVEEAAPAALEAAASVAGLEEPPALGELDIERPAELAEEAALSLEPSAPVEEGPTGEVEASVEYSKLVEEGLTELPELEIELPGSVEPPEPAEPEEPLVRSVLDEAGEGEQEVGVEMGGLEIESFDEELEWDAGERISHQISKKDLEEAQKAHEESLDAPAHSLPGMEEEEVPEVGVEERDIPQAEDVVGLEEVEGEGPEGPAELEGVEEGVVSGFEPTMVEEVAEEAAEAAGAAELVADAVEAAEEAAEVAEAAEAAEAPAAWEVEEEVPPAAPAAEEMGEEEVAAAPAAGVGEGVAEEELPLILPEDVAAEPEPPTAEPEPELVVTETMAELYASQGLYDEAREIYQQLLAAQPDDPALRARLAEVEARVAAAGASAAPVREARFAAAMTGGLSVGAMFEQLFAASPPRVEEVGEEGTEPAAPPSSAPSPPSPPTPPEASREGGTGSSFDEFFGAEKAPPAVEAEPGAPAEDAGDDTDDDDDFRAWLKSLKT